MRPDRNGLELMHALGPIGVAFAAVIVATIVKAFHERIERRIVKDGRGIACSRPVAQHAVFRAPAFPIRPALQHIAEVDDELVGLWRHVDPFPALGQDLQPRVVVGEQQRDHAVVGVRAACKNAVVGIALGGFVSIQPQRGDGVLEMGIKVGRLHIQRHGEHLDDLMTHRHCRLIVPFHRRLEVRNAMLIGRPLVGTAQLGDVVHRIGLRNVLANVEALLRVALILLHSRVQSLVAQCQVSPTHGAVHHHQLLLNRKLEEGLGLVKDPVDGLLIDAVVVQVEEANLEGCVLQGLDLVRIAKEFVDGAQADGRDVLAVAAIVAAAGCHHVACFCCHCCFVLVWFRM
mmetsp:Transcript_828/g.2352  ORF Transcript_828/g.2352 Transcript_828/m.2352 type:complete len:345 (-) Transcript_828:65-1099(-)